MADIKPYEIQSDDGIPVGLPSGATFSVMTSEEKDYLEDKIKRYLSENRFVNISDYQDIDKMIVFELLIHRWTLWVSRGRDYFDEDIPFKVYADMCNSFSTEVRLLKKSLGIDKMSRDRSRGDDSIPALWDNLLRRAKEFSYARNEQAVQVLTSFQRLKAVLTFSDNCDAVERKENHCELEDVISVLREEIAKFDAIDESFRHSVQSTWIREM